MAHRRCTDSAWRDRGAGARRLIEIGPAQNERGWIIAEAKSGSTLNPARSAANERRGGPAGRAFLDGARAHAAYPVDRRSPLPGRVTVVSMRTEQPGRRPDRVFLDS